MKVKQREKTFSKTKLGDKKKRSSLHGVGRKRFCRLCVDKVKSIDYKDTKRLEAFITERGKVTPSRLSGNCAKHQRMVVEAITRARFIALLPYVR
jgi:small subunit ribosomal protein S18